MPQLHDPTRLSFESDNGAGAHPDVLAAVVTANGGHVGPYGTDPYTERLREVVRAEFGERARVFPVFNGTGANVVSLQAMSPRWGGVVCTSDAHIATDENAAPERIAGLKLIDVPTADGKLRPDDVLAVLRGRHDVHTALPAVVSLTESTELGTAYSPDELAALTGIAHEHGLRVHVDGSRLANAAAFFDVPLAALTRDVGVDVLSLGGTKNGALGAEAIVVLDPDAAPGIEYLQKIDLQLASKARYLSAQLLALLDDDLWLRCAGDANAMAQRLAAGLATIPGVALPLAVQANGVFPVLPDAVRLALHERFAFHDWPGAEGMARFLCAWDTTPAFVDELVAAARDAASQPA
ncbi:threonine aldolase [Pseudoclavibacter chungangensis]|uniref:Threonine aldolase n=1 Tax=Pseudoclavibacter chungangensis TaxID=587635 RepID=A0A7J5C163_9MICO|nr:threonine aldolase [Pseudoclavibacter chungangensis]